MRFGVQWFATDESPRPDDVESTSDAGTQKTARNQPASAPADAARPRRHRQPRRRRRDPDPRLHLTAHPQEP
jgi:hypothetical protein